MNWYENAEGRKQRMKLRGYSRRRFHQKKIHLEETSSSL